MVISNSERKTAPDDSFLLRVRLRQRTLITNQKSYIMNFKLFKSKGKEVLIDVDKIIVVNFDSENGLTTINCTDHVIVTVDDSVEEIKDKIGIKRTTGGFRRPN